MIEKISPEELDFMEEFYNPIALAECIFSDFENLNLQDDERLGHYRLGQIVMCSFEYLLDFNPKLTRKENFRLREGAGTIYAFGARKYGKTQCVENIDITVSALLQDNEEVAFSSYDAIHIRGVLDKVIQFFETNSIVKQFYKKSTKSPNYRIEMKHGWTLDGINMNIQSKSPGSQWFQKHVKRIYLEEASFETEEVYKKRIDAVSELGCVIRAAGMTNFTKYSPVGKIFYEPDTQKFVSNYPQYVNPEWDDKKKSSAMREHSGEQSLSYQVFVVGRVIEDGASVFDMERIRKNYLPEEKEVKHIEIRKEAYHEFADKLILDRPSGVDEVHLHADIGESAPTEIAIFFKVGELFRYVYNVTLYSLTDDEQTNIFKFIAGRLNATVIGIDTTEGTGRAIFRALEVYYGSRDNLVWCAFNEKTFVDYERDEQGKIIFKDGKPEPKEEYVSEWTIKRLKLLLYDGFLKTPLDYKLDVQLNSVISTQGASGRVVYECVSEEDHLLSAFRVFSLAQWLTEFKKLLPLMNKKFAKRGVFSEGER